VSGEWAECVFAGEWKMMKMMEDDYALAREPLYFFDTRTNVS